MDDGAIALLLIERFERGQTLRDGEEPSEWFVTHYVAIAAAVRAALIPPTLADDLTLVLRGFGEIVDGNYGPEQADYRQAHRRLAAFAAELRGEGVSDGG